MARVDSASSTLPQPAGLPSNTHSPPIAQHPIPKALASMPLLPIVRVIAVLISLFLHKFSLLLCLVSGRSHDTFAAKIAHSPKGENLRSIARYQKHGNPGLSSGLYTPSWIPKLTQHAHTFVRSNDIDPSPFQTYPTYFPASHRNFPAGNP
jgi:hypothetical protein